MLNFFPLSIKNMHACRSPYHIGTTVSYFWFNQSNENCIEIEVWQLWKKDYTQQGSH